MLEIVGECVGTPWLFYVMDIDTEKRTNETLGCFGSRSDAEAFVWAKQYGAWVDGSLKKVAAFGQLVEKTLDDVNAEVKAG